MPPSATRIKVSEYEIPFHIQEEIMTRLPVKSLIQFRSVSKAWKSLIDSSDFIAAHCIHSQTQPQHLLVSSYDRDLYEGGKYVSYIDDGTLPHQRSVLTLPRPLSTKQIIHPDVVGSFCGLVCLYDIDPSSNKALLWNPSIRKSITVDVPAKLDGIGFGVCPVTNDPKIVSITKSLRNETDMETKVMVYTLSSGNWRSLSTYLPTVAFRTLFSPVVTDQLIYWRAESQTHEMIISFDVTGESFEVIDLPDSLARHDREDMGITKLRESLAIHHYNGNGICTVWMMENGVKRSFTKLLTIKPPHNSICAFRKNGIPIMQVADINDVTIKLVVYEPTSDHNNILEIAPYIFNVKSYMETLLLLGRSDCISY